MRDFAASSIASAAPRARFWERLRAVTLSDAAVMTLLAIGFAAPLWAPLVPKTPPPAPGETAIDARPIWERLRDGRGQVVRAERDVVVLPDDAPTLWSGHERVRANRAVAPDWVRAALHHRGLLPPSLALTTPPRHIAIERAPVWSPDLAAARGAVAAAILADAPDLALMSGADAPDVDTWSEAADSDVRSLAGLDDAVALGLIETASIRAPGRPLRAAYAPRPRPDRSGARAPLSRADPWSTPRRVASSGFGLTIVLTSVGMHKEASHAALDALPPEVAVAVAPVADDAADWVRRAKAQGRVTLIEVPMEPTSYPRNDPGPLTLLTGSSPEENTRRLAAALAGLPPADGVSFYLGSRFKSDAAALAPVLLALRDLGYAAFDPSPRADSVLSAEARAAGVALQVGEVNLARALRIDGPTRALDTLHRASEQGGVIAVAPASPQTVSALARWLSRADELGLKLRALAL